jgi:hypothetical protein
MKKLLLISFLFLEACGNESVQNELVGQVKRVVNKTPLICSNYTQADVSMGVMRNGTGSVSKEDVYLTVINPEDVKSLKEAADAGIPVKITYDVKRLTFCIESHIVTKVEPAP